MKNQKFSHRNRVASYVTPQIKEWLVNRAKQSGLSESAYLSYLLTKLAQNAALVD